MTENKGEDASDKDAFLEQVRRTRAELERTKDFARELQRSAHFAGEIADATHDGFSALPQDQLTREDWQRYTVVWQGLENYASGLRIDASVPDYLWGRAYSVATTSNTVMFDRQMVEWPQVHVARVEERGLEAGDL